MTQWYYSDYQRNRHGPVAARDMADLHNAGQLQADTLVWAEGMPQWRAWREVMNQALDEAAGRGAPALEAAPLSAGVNPYAIAEPRSDAPVESASPYSPPRAALQQESDFVAGTEVVHAGFWKRYAALFIDSFVVGIAYYLIVIVAMLVGFGAAGVADAGSDALGAGMVGLMVAVYVLYPVISGVYYVSMESSSLQATLGKMAVGIKVTDNDGRRLSRANALGRWASHLLCYVTLYIGYLLAAFTERKRGLHDMVAGTLVVDKWAYTAQPERQRRSLGAVTIVMIVLSLLAVLAYFAIILAIALPAYQSYVQRAGG